MTRDQTLRSIAQEHLAIGTFETRRDDSLDFHNVLACHVGSALAAAYEAGAAGLSSAAEALIAARDSRMDTSAEWEALRRAVRNARRSI